MMAAERFDIQFTWATEPTGPQPCVYAAQFQVWCDELAGRLMGEPNIVAVNQSKLLLQDRLHSWRESVPKKHRDYLGNGHICIWHVYEDMYKKLRMTELALTPPPLSIPETPKRKKAVERLEFPAINGIAFIGEKMDS